MENKVKAAGLAMIVSGVSSVGLTLLAMLMNLLGDEKTERENLRGLAKFFGGMSADELERAYESSRTMSMVLSMGWLVIGLGACAMIIYGGMRMYQMRQWPAAMAAAILLIVPCLTPACCTCGLVSGIGVWALIVLLDAQTKAAFKP
ncbi:MAG: hypothetical protein IT453_04030 [Planctomycetes bacterium]|nr:hypothetical protein [Planctomycetota bacterium]